MWTGTRRVAFVPLHRTNAHPPDFPVPDDWAGDITRRVLDDPDPTGADRSLRAFIQTVSSGIADIEPTVLPMQLIDQQDVPPDALEDQLGDKLRGEGFDAAALVMLGGPGAGQGQRGGFWARFVMAEGVGVWAMELMHCLTGFDDLYPFNGNLGLYDEMAANAATHPTSWTKAAIGWLDPAAIAVHSGREATYRLYPVESPQPPPPGRVTGVRIAGPRAPYLMVEARRRTDQFDRIIPAEGVIGYRIQTDDPHGTTQNGLAPAVLLTLTAGGQASAVGVGTSTVLDNGIEVAVTAEDADGYTVTITDPDAHVVDRTALDNAPLAVDGPTGLFVPATGVKNLGYRDGAGHLHELWRDSEGRTGTTDLTANAGAPPAAGAPFFQRTGDGPQQVLYYRDTVGAVRSLWWDYGAVGIDDLSGYAGAPHALAGAAGDPVAWYHDAADTHHVVYAMPNGHLQELYWAGAAPVAGGGDLTGSAGAPPAAGRAAPMVDASGTQIVVFRSSDGLIRDLYWTTGAVGHEILSGTAGSPPAAFDPTAYWTAHDDVHEVVYVDGQGQVQELWWAGVAPVQGRALTTPSGSPHRATGTPAAYYLPETDSRHVVFRGEQGSLVALSWSAGSTYVEGLDLTAAFGLVPAAGDPTPIVVPGSALHRLGYRGVDGHVYEVAW